MTIQEALHKVEEVGYPIHSSDATIEANGISCGERVQKVLLDPIFWFALGWSLGWHDKNHLEYDEWWRGPWHRFLDHLSEGKPPGPFFEYITEDSVYVYNGCVQQEETVV